MRHGFRWRGIVPILTLWVGLTGLGPVGVQAQTALTIETLETGEILTSPQGRLGGVSVEADGTVLVSNFHGNLWRVAPDGTTEVVANNLYGTSGNLVLPDGRVLQNAFAANRTFWVAADGSVTTLAADLEGPVGLGHHEGRIFITNCTGNAITVVEPGGDKRTLARGGKLNCPNSVVMGPDGWLRVVNYSGPDILAIHPETGEMKTVALLEGGPNAHIVFTGGSFYVTQISSGKLFRMEVDGTMEMLIGGAGQGLEDGPVPQGRLKNPNGIAVGPEGRWLYVNDIVGTWAEPEPTHLLVRRIGPLPLPPPGPSR